MWSDVEGVDVMMPKNKQFSDEIAFGCKVGRMVASVLTIGLLSMGVASASQKEVADCMRLLSVDRSIIAARMNGESKKDWLEMMRGLDSLIPIIERAWDIPIPESNEDVDRLITTFASERYGNCIKRV